MEKQTWIALTLTLSFLSCAAPAQKVVKSKKEIQNEILDAPVSTKRGSVKRNSDGDSMLILPDTPKEMSRQIDGDLGDWEGTKFKKFQTKKYVTEGETFWKGAKDASFRVAVDSDSGFFYVGAEIKDDKIVDVDDGDEHADGIVITLRDPGLDYLERSLPSGVGLEEYVDAMTRILVLPDGRVRALDDTEESTLEQFVTAATDQRKNGWVVEVAIRLEAFGEVSAIPLPELAFRVDLHDGDEPDRAGMQTELSTVDADASGKRLARYQVGGILPHAALADGPPRTNAIGRWKYDDKAWSFASFEVVPNYWNTLDDPTSFEEALKKEKSFRSVCSSARHDIHLVEAYQSKAGKKRVGLVLCGERANDNDACSSKATSEVFWIELTPKKGGWKVKNTIEVFDNSLAQCTFQPRSKEDFISGLSLFPLDMMGSAYWMVGWTKTLDSKAQKTDAYGVTLLNTKSDTPKMAQLLTNYNDADFEERKISKTSVFFTAVDDNKDVDICQLEQLDEQNCSGVNQRCSTPEKGRQILSHSYLWDRKKKKFDLYEFSRHKNCNASTFDFSKREAYLILQLRDRVGLLPSPLINAAAEDSLDLF